MKVNIPTLTKLAALFFVFAVLLAALAIAVYDLLTGQPIAYIVIAVLATGLGTALNFLGMSQAASRAGQYTAAALATVNQNQAK